MPRGAASLSCSVLLLAAPAATLAAGTEPMPRRLSATQSMLRNGCASGMATVCTRTLLQPFDTLKTIQQMGGGGGGVVATASAIVQERGVGALYRGLGVAMIGAVPAMSLYMASYKACKRSLGNAFENAPPLLIIAISASLANSAASVLRVPCELVKQRLQAGIYPNLLVAVSTLAASGARGFFVPGALASQLARDIPFGVLMLVTYESLTALMPRPKDGSPPAAWHGMVCGALAGAVATLVTNPMDVLKTRMLTTTGAALASTPLGVASALAAAEGWAVFYRGVVPRLCHKIPASAMFWLLYEAFARLLGASGVAAERGAARARKAD